MYRIMVQGAEVPDVERTRPLREADAACISQRFHLQRAASKNSYGSLEQLVPAIIVPAFLPLANFQQRHGQISEGIVFKVLLHELDAVRPKSF